jgi:hypothetical protein
MKCLASEKSKMIWHEEYLKCENALRKKTEEVEKLRTEIKDLKEIMKLEKELSEENISGSRCCCESENTKESQKEESFGKSNLK